MPLLLLVVHLDRRALPTPPRPPQAGVPIHGRREKTAGGLTYE